MNESIKPLDVYSVMYPQYPDVVTVTDISSMLGISKAKAYELIHTGVIKSLPCGKNFKVPKIMIIDFVLNGFMTQSQIKKEW